MSILDEHRCPGCGRLARVVRHESGDSRLSQIDGDEPVCDVRPAGNLSWLRCGRCSRAAAHDDGAPTLRRLLLADGGLPIGPGLGRLLVEAIEGREVLPSPYPEAAEALLEATAIARAEPAYTSDPPPPSPDGVTWYRYTNRHEPDPIWLAVRGDLTFAVSQSAREPIAWERGIPLRCWRYDERRTVDPVSRPSWAEGEGE